MTDPIVDIRNLTVEFKKKQKFLAVGGTEVARKRALNSISFSVKDGETFGIVGETGSGKTTLARTLVGIYKPKDYFLKILGREIDFKKKRDILFLRDHIGIVFQDPVGSLNPKISIYDIILEGLPLGERKSKEEIERRIGEAAAFVDLPVSKLESYPTELSGGEKQRVSLARTIIGDKKILLLDEPTSSLDVSIQAQILNLLRRLRKELFMTYILITHDLNVIKYMCDRVAVLYYGQILEVGETREIFEHPLHPYTSDLISANVTFSSSMVFSDKAITGEPAAEGCVYKNLCAKRFTKCDGVPAAFSMGPSLVKCWLYEDRGTPVTEN